MSYRVIRFGSHVFTFDLQEVAILMDLARNAEDHLRFFGDEVSGRQREHLRSQGYIEEQAGRWGLTTKGVKMVRLMGQVEFLVCEGRPGSGYFSPI